MLGPLPGSSTERQLCASLGPRADLHPGLLTPGPPNPTWSLTSRRPRPYIGLPSEAHGLRGPAITTKNVKGGEPANSGSPEISCWAGKQIRGSGEGQRGECTDNRVAFKAKGRETFLHSPFSLLHVDATCCRQPGALWAEAVRLMLKAAPFLPASLTDLLSQLTLPRGRGALCPAPFPGGPGRALQGLDTNNFCKKLQTSGHGSSNN